MAVYNSARSTQINVCADAGFGSRKWTVNRQNSKQACLIYDTAKNRIINFGTNRQYRNLEPYSNWV